MGRKNKEEQKNESGIGACRDGRAMQPGERSRRPFAHACANVFSLPPLPTSTQDKQLFAQRDRPNSSVCTRGGKELCNPRKFALAERSPAARDKGALLRRLPTATDKSLLPPRSEDARHNGDPPPRLQDVWDKGFPCRTGAQGDLPYAPPRRNISAGKSS